MSLVQGVPPAAGRGVVGVVGSHVISLQAVAVSVGLAGGLDIVRVLRSLVGAAPSDALTLEVDFRLLGDVGPGRGPGDDAGVEVYEGGELLAIGLLGAGSDSDLGVHEVSGVGVEDELSFLEDLGAAYFQEGANVGRFEDAPVAGGVEAEGGSGLRLAFMDEESFDAVTLEVRDAGLIGGGRYLLGRVRGHERAGGGIYATRLGQAPTATGRTVPPVLV